MTDLSTSVIYVGKVLSRKGICGIIFNFTGLRSLLVVSNVGRVSRRKKTFQDTALCIPMSINTNVTNAMKSLSTKTY